MKNLNEKVYNQVLQEASDYFRSQGINIIGEGYREIATNVNLFESYVDLLTEGASADHAEVLGQLMANTNSNILRESSMSGIAPIASLSMPVIRKLWPKFALKDALKTEVAKTPRFVVTYTKPYMFRGDNERIELPRGLRDRKNVPGQGLFDQNPTGKTYVTVKGSDPVSLPYATISGVSGMASLDFSNPANYDGVFLSNSSSNSKIQPLDGDLEIVEVLVEVKDTAVSSPIASQIVSVKVPVHKLDVSNSIFLEINDTVKATTGTGTTESVTIKGQLLVRADLKAAKLLIATIGFSIAGTLFDAIEDITVFVKAGVSTEFNEDAWSVGFDIERMDINIPTGQHLNAPLPIEALNDMMALYQIDGTKEAVDLMTNVLAKRLDLEVLAFLEKSFANQPGVAEFAGYPDSSDYSVRFDVRPSAGFAGSPKAWREELKPQIDWLAQKIKNETYLQSGIFTIVANPLDVQILSNIDWQFRGGQGANMDGVDVDYSIGTYMGAHAYRVISSVQVPQGDMYLMFIPSADGQMTYKYYPYTFSTEQGYIDPNRSRVPSIMMTKRHQFAEFMPAIGQIRIVNNNKGYGQFNPGYAPVETDSGDGWDTF